MKSYIRIGNTRVACINCVLYGAVNARYALTLAVLPIVKCQKKSHRKSSSVCVCA